MAQLADAPDLKFGELKGCGFKSRQRHDTSRGCSSVGRARPCQGRGRRFEPGHPLHASIAQLVERLICNQQVAGSTPAAGSKHPRAPASLHDTVVRMLTVNHVVAGAIIGRLSKNHPVLGFTAGFASHLLLDSFPHWGLEADRPNREEYFLGIAKKDGLSALVLMGAFTLLSDNKLTVLGAMTGAVLPDIDHPLSHFTGKSISPKAFVKLHVGIQRGKEKESRLTQEILTSSLGAALVLASLWRTRAPVRA